MTTSQVLGARGWFCMGGMTRTATLPRRIRQRRTQSGGPDCALVGPDCPGKRGAWGLGMTGRGVNAVGFAEFRGSSVLLARAQFAFIDDALDVAVVLASNPVPNAVTR
jgi:hypothetical protein